ncbi:hypothetical protein CLV24_13220 [Pontibacter ummariensis]|uniref:Uncharacterized protein n=1 Tax=Pontibacter ummariensis TaxID=1610492 RepID=A0A239KX44_9BACT|nr:hypothetical protein [Pontibacter ummariensis]PRY04942.1 hypothetical protein CLV24_13220 [Pontibacter ummariensis]SNT22312.1 hypothetical protein SAMN06296052_13226 [Pontibacter ummariensis]
MRLKVNKIIALAGLVFALSFVVTDAYSQCAMCRATVESNVGTGKGSQEPASEVGQGLNTGILYLMAVPYVLIGAVGFLWYKYSRKKA